MDRSLPSLPHPQHPGGGAEGEWTGPGGGSIVTEAAGEFTARPLPCLALQQPCLCPPPQYLAKVSVFLPLLLFILILF